MFTDVRALAKVSPAGPWRSSENLAEARWGRSMSTWKESTQDNGMLFWGVASTGMKVARNKVLQMNRSLEVQITIMDRILHQQWQICHCNWQPDFFVHRECQCDLWETWRPREFQEKANNAIHRLFVTFYHFFSCLWSFVVLSFPCALQPSWFICTLLMVCFSHIIQRDGCLWSAMIFHNPWHKRLLGWKKQDGAETLDWIAQRTPFSRVEVRSPMPRKTK